MTRTIIFERPEIAKIPSTESTHKRSSTEPTVWNGPGKIPIAQATTASMRISHKVTG